MKRVLLCSLSVPWPHKPLLGLYHVQQAGALNDIGVEVEIFSPAPSLFWPLTGVWHKARQHTRRPGRYDVSGITVHSPQVPFTFPRIARFRITPLFPSSITALMDRTVGPALERVIDQYKPDTLLVHGVMPWGRLALRVSRQKGILCAFIEHSHEDVLRLQPGSRLGRHYILLASKADAIFAVGKPMADHLEMALGLKTVFYLLNGVTTLKPDRTRADRPRELRGQLVVLSAGQYYRRKGFDELVTAFTSIASDIPNAHLYIVTKPPAKLVQRVRISKHADRIHFMDPVAHDVLLQWMGWADLFVLPSWSEAFDLVYAEAMSMGSPIILTRDSGMARVIGADSGDKGWVVPPRDTTSLSMVLRSALLDPVRLARMGQACRDYANKAFSWPANAKLLQEIIVGQSRLHTSAHRSDSV